MDKRPGCSCNRNCIGPGRRGSRRRHARTVTSTTRQEKTRHNQEDTHRSKFSESFDAKSGAGQFGQCLRKMLFGISIPHPMQRTNGRSACCGRIGGSCLTVGAEILITVRRLRRDSRDPSPRPSLARHPQVGCQFDWPEPSSECGTILIFVFTALQPKLRSNGHKSRDAR
jgi:hypothetical protein